MKTLRKNSLARGVMLMASVLFAFLVVCPYLCASAAEHSAHSCCPRSAQPQPDQDSSHDCSQHSRAVLQQDTTSVDLAPDVQPLSFFIPSDHLMNLTVLDGSLSMILGPPVAFTGQPLYLSKKVFLI